MTHSPKKMRKKYSTEKLHCVSKRQTPPPLLVQKTTTSPQATTNTKITTKRADRNVPTKHESKKINDYHRNNINNNNNETNTNYYDEDCGKQLITLADHIKTEKANSNNHNLANSKFSSKLEACERVRNAYHQKIVSFFDKGDAKNFFKLWNETLFLIYKNHHNILGTNIPKFEFRLRIYFATNPLRKTPPDKQEYKKSLSELKYYLEEGSGSDLATHADLVQFFALPYVPDPQKHPIFKQILHKDWLNTLRSDLLFLLTKITDSIEANEYLLLLRSLNDRNYSLRSSNRQPMKANASHSNSSLSDEENQRKVRGADQNIISNIINEFVEFLERSRGDKFIPPEMLASFSHRLKIASEVRKSSKNATVRKHEIRPMHPADTVGKSDESGSDIPPPPLPPSMKKTSGFDIDGGTPQTSRESISPVPNPLTSGRKKNLPASANKKENTQTLLKKTESMGNLIPTDPPKARTSGHQNSSRSSANTPKDVNTAKATKTPLNQSSNDVEEEKSHGINRVFSQQPPFRNAFQNNKCISNNGNSSDITYGDQLCGGSKKSHTPVINCLNFTKISNQLVVNPGTRGSALLMQAIRQQLTRTNSLILSNNNLQIFAEKDILSLRNRKNSVVATILRQTEPSPETKEELARLLNAISSFNTGRKYLLSVSQGKELLYELALALRTKRLAGHASDHVLAALQKLSIRTSVQKELVLCGMIEWLLLFLDLSGANSGDLNSCAGVAGSGSVTGQGTMAASGLFVHRTNFGLEFAQCLLSNLFLNAVSQTTILRYRHQIVAILSHLLSHKASLTKYTCHSLYCAMGMYARVRQAARERDLETILNDRIAKAPNHESACQLSVVLKTFRGEVNFERRKWPSDGEDLDQEDYLEAEIDSTDTLLPTLTELFGEKLLQQKFCVAFDEVLPPQFSTRDEKPNNGDNVLGTVAISRRGVVKQFISPQMKPHIIRRKRQLQPSPAGVTPNGAASMRRRSTTVCESRGLGHVSRDSSGPSNVHNVVRFAEDERTSSMMSHTTFVLENDKRKPLLVPCGFETAIATCSASANISKIPPKSFSMTNIRVNVIPEEKSRCSPPPPEPYTKEINGKEAGVTNSHLTQHFAHKTVANNKHGISSGVIAKNKTPQRKPPWRPVLPISQHSDVSGCSTHSDEKENATVTPQDNNNSLGGGGSGNEVDEEAELKAFAPRPKVVRTPEYRSKSDLTKTSEINFASRSHHD